MTEMAFRREHARPARHCGWWHELAMTYAMASRIGAAGAADLPPGARLAVFGRVWVASLPFPVIRPPDEPELVIGGDADSYQVAISPTPARDVMSAGAAGRHQPGRPQPGNPRPGRLLLVEGGQAARRASSRHLARCVVARFPRPLLPCAPATVRDVWGRPLRAASGVGALLHTFLTQIDRDGGGALPVDRPRLGSIILDLAASLINAEAGRASSTPARGVAPLARIKAFIAANLHDPGLTPAGIAGAHHISVRHLHRLFGQDGRGVSSHLRHSRLERCRRDLEDPRLAHTPVHAIGARWGFPRAAEFSRSFRTAYGLPPGQYRSTVLAASPPNPRRRLARTPQGPVL